jgi:hypothetical protein
MENAAADATAAAGRLQRALDELRVARDVLESLGKQGQAMALTHIVQEIEGVLRSIDRGTALAYPGSVER